MSAILSEIRCKHCNARFPPPRLPISECLEASAQPGQQGRIRPNAAARALQATLQNLMLHLSQAHKEIAMQAVMQGAQLQGVLILKNFLLTDDIAKEGDIIRWQVHQATRAVHVSDAKIAEHVAAAALDKMPPEQIAGKVQALMQELRDVITERGRFQDATAPPDTAATA